MRLSTSVFAAAAAFLTQIVPLASAGHEPYKAAQINFYTNTACTAYVGEMPFWHAWKGTPGILHMFDFDGPDGPGDCHDFRQPGGTQSLNLAQCWTYSGSNKDKNSHSCYCEFWDDWGCKGNKASAPSGNTNCLAGRGPAGYQWKSAKCYQWN